MGMFLLILFAAAEIALTIITCTKFRSIWHRNKAVFCAAELIIVILVMILPATGQRWRFAVCAAVLAVRLVISGLVFLVKRGKNSKEKSNAGAIASAFFGMLLIGISLIPAFVFTGYNGLETTGEYGVKHTNAILIDSSRLEAKENDGSYREVPIHFFYPDGNAENCPFVLFAHGSFGYYESNTSLYMELASHGYVVASIDHPYYAFFTKDTKGKTVIVDMDFMKTAINMENNLYTEEEEFSYSREWLSVRAADENFVIDSVKAAKSSGSLSDAWFTDSEKKKNEILNVLKMTNTDVIGLTGHSIGGAVAVQLGRERNDITAVIDIDGTMLSEEKEYSDGHYTFINEPYPIPLLSLDNDGHWSNNYNYEFGGGMIYINKFVLNNAADGREMHFDGTAHMDFTDLPLLSPTLAEMFGSGSVDPNKFVPELNGVILNYFDHYLKGEGELAVSKWTPAD